MISKLYDEGAVVLDTESTGGAIYDEIIEIGIVEAMTGKILFESRINPTVDKINFYAEKIHKISIDDLSREPSLSEIWETLCPILLNRPVLAYNYSADKRFIEQSVHANSLFLPDLNWGCIMDMYRIYSNRNQSVNLSKACKEMAVSEGNHSAISDALAAARILYRMHRGFKPLI